ncbi:unnamed protein product [Lactuca virosa]|uniref:Uncharacterized protein n=1 Tax=Lactuca virosa TaxID=75947 RepID=A0AAU9NQC0_9ASTR|nr:unnamed protein product [Lactuca virosa]
MVAEEHVAPARPNLISSFEVVDDSDDDDANDDDDISDDDNNDSDDEGMDFRMYVPPKEPISKDVDTPAKTAEDVNIFKQSNDPTPEQMDSLIAQLQSTARKPSQTVPFISDSPSESDKMDSNASLAPRKQKRKDPRPGVLYDEPVQQPSPITEPTQVAHDAQSQIVEPVQVIQYVQSPIIETAPVQENVQSQMINEETFPSVSSSAPPPPEHDAASVKLSKLLAFQYSFSQSKGKGISIGSKQGGDEDSHPTVSELNQEIMLLKQESIEKDLLIGSLDVRVSSLKQENSVKDAKISELQANLWWYN